MRRAIIVFGICLFAVPVVWTVLGLSWKWYRANFANDLRVFVGPSSADTAVSLDGAAPVAVTNGMASFRVPTGPHTIKITWPAGTETIPVQVLRGTSHAVRGEKKLCFVIVNAENKYLVGGPGVGEVSHRFDQTDVELPADTYWDNDDLPGVISPGTHVGVLYPCHCADLDLKSRDLIEALRVGPR